MKPYPGRLMTYTTRAVRLALYWLGRAVPPWRMRLACTSWLRGTKLGFDLLVRTSR